MVERDTDIKLLYDFNLGISEAYNAIYMKFYEELHYYSYKLFASTTVGCDDVVQEVFLNLWEKKKHSFESLSHIKNYLYMAVRNKYKDYLNHNHHVRNYEQEVQLSDQELFTGMVEAETVMLMKSVSELLPEECAKIFQMYMEGWEIKDIAQELKKSPSTVYTQRTRAIEILKQKIDKNLLLLLLGFRSVLY